MIVQKYGGTSLATPARVRRVARRIASQVAAGEQVVAVVSAMGHTTDRLIGLAHRVNPDPPARELDMLIANGETISAPLVAMCLQGLGVDAISLTGPQAGIRTSQHHSRARIHEIDPARINQCLERGQVVVVAGFQGATEEGEITTLGRGASDLTAVALAAALKARSCEILTDVDGILTADPRVVPDARLLHYVTYEEILEMAAVGARVMQPRSVEIGQLYGVPIHVRSSFHMRPGTMIVAQVPMENRNRVRGVAHENEVAKITVLEVPDRPGIAASIFQVLAEHSVSVDVIVQNVSSGGKTDLTFTVGEADLKRAVALVNPVAAEIGAKGVSQAGGLAKVSIVGTGMLGTPGIAATMFTTLAAEKVNIEMISTSEIRITCIVGRTEVARAVRALHSAFQLDQVTA